ncbi:MAG: FkbM family methyltransferase [Tissierellia bacterium]|nr:FkbM family methyltransferase [Tissierellia bacterium]
MSFISYAQNFEDIMLWRALKHIENGFYIDVGAGDPHQDSVTKAFYERGWRGINIEPIPQLYEKLVRERPRDINLQVAAGDKEKEIVIYELPDTGLSTLDLSIAERHEKERGYKKVERIVKSQTLTQICKDIHLSPIHFLKIDVEGAEKEVLEGTDFSIVRPWIILVESTIPNSRIENYSEWEPILLNANYEFVYFDGLNRFYVAKEHPELKESFKLPPNCFDGFVVDEKTPFCSPSLVQTKLQLSEANKETDKLKMELNEANKKIDNLQRELEAAISKVAELSQACQYWRKAADDLNQELQMVYSSKSWRLTLPLRLGNKYIKWLLSQPKKASLYFLRKAIAFVLARPVLKSKALLILNRKPKLKAKLKMIDQGKGLVNHPRNNKQYYDENLTARANRIYKKLNYLINKQGEKENI